jgi:hypothetical protein
MEARTAPTVYLSNLIIADGSNPRPIPIYEDGGGIYNDRAKLTMQSCTVRNCFATNTGGQFSRPSGGGVMSFGATAELTVAELFLHRKTSRRSRAVRWKTGTGS